MHNEFFSILIQINNIHASGRNTIESIAVTLLVESYDIYKKINDASIGRLPTAQTQ